MRAPPPDLARLTAAAAKAARDAVDDLLTEHLRSTIDEPGLSNRMDRAWRRRWRHHPGGNSRSSAVMDAYLGDDRIAALETAATAALRGLSPPPPPAGSGAAWRDGWMEGWARVGRPAGRRGDAIDENWAALIEEAGEQAGAAALDRAGRHIAGTVVESRRLAIYGAWVAVAQFCAGPAIEEASDWRDWLKGYWRPFHGQAMAGLGWCWLTPDAVVCLPRPAIRRVGDETIADWPNGERTLA